MMMKAVSLGLILASLVVAGCGAKKSDEAAPAANGAVKATPQTTCPVMGRPINTDLYVDALGKRIYVCCRDCVAAVQKDPAKYIAKLQAEGVVVADAPVAEGMPPAAGGEGMK